MARYKMRKRPTMDTQKANSPIASVNDSPLPFQEQHSVDDLQPADAKKLCHFCLRVACMETGAKEASSIESEMGQIYVQLIGEKVNRCGIHLKYGLKTYNKHFFFVSIVGVQ